MFPHCITWKEEMGKAISCKQPCSWVRNQLLLETNCQWNWVFYSSRKTWLKSTAPIEASHSIMPTHSKQEPQHLRCLPSVLMKSNHQLKMMMHCYRQLISKRRQHHNRPMSWRKLELPLPLQSVHPLLPEQLQSW